MGRKADPWWSDDRRPTGYHVTFNGRKVSLHECDKCDKPTGPNYRRALEALDRLRVEEGEIDPADQTFGIALVRWQRHLEVGNVATAAVARNMFRDLSKKMEHIDVSRLTAKMLLEYVEGRDSWGETTKAAALKRLKACFAYNMKKSHCTFNPLAKVKVQDHYRELPRGEECVLPLPLRDLLTQRGSQAWRDLTIALSLTGARPGELAKAGRLDYRPGDKQIVLKEWKNSRKLRRKDTRRYIVLPDEVDEMVRHNLRRGDLCFPSARAKKWTVSSMWEVLHRHLDSRTVADWMHENCHDPDTVIMYSFRHTFATQAILKEVNIAMLANLMGTSVKEIEDTYSHAISQVGGMRAAAMKAIGR